jgi:hypothetical protein
MPRLGSEVDLAQGFDDAVLPLGRIIADAMDA